MLSLSHSASLSKALSLSKGWFAFVPSSQNYSINGPYHPQLQNPHLFSAPAESVDLLTLPRNRGIMMLVACRSTSVKCIWKIPVCLIALAGTLTSGCCYPSDRYLPFRIDGIVKDGSGNSIKNERIVVTALFFGDEREIVSATDQEGHFSCDAFITESAVVCFVPPTFLLWSPKEPHFNISIPNRSRYDYEIDFPNKEFKSKKIEVLPSNQNSNLGDKEIEIQGILRRTKHSPDFYAIVELDMMINNKRSPSK